MAFNEKHIRYRILFISQEERRWNALNREDAVANLQKLVQEIPWKETLTLRTGQIKKFKDRNYQIESKPSSNKKDAASNWTIDWNERNH